MRIFILTVFMLGLTFGMGAPAQAKDFNSWLMAFKVEAQGQGITSKTWDSAFDKGMGPIARIIELDNKQPEKTKTFEEYITSVVNQKRIDTGRTRYLNNKHTLEKIGEKYGVDPAAIVALWGIETNFGGNTGGYSVINALATLAYDGRREVFFKAELLNALKIIQAGHIRAADMKGSWAGAMGQCQFMPSSFLRFAEDYNGDGRRDIWTTESDVFASAANYLNKSGWKKDEPWGREVELPAGFNNSLLGMDTQKPLQYWHDRGARLKGGKSIPFEGSYLASIVQPDGAGTRAFIVYDNYRTIMKWNKSVYFATSVGLLTDAVGKSKNLDFTGQVR